MVYNEIICYRIVIVYIPNLYRQRQESKAEKERDWEEEEGKCWVEEAGVEEGQDGRGGEGREDLPASGSLVWEAVGVPRWPGGRVC